ncbi:hypothetical protein [Amycolatopsis sp. RTGN1]|uniref:hypothetical protein n=1 Tax=Amycolatopsis ponsaeliensis TaxID=2992142 RepID=UPI002549E90B|nr:hypothetical protein [Amycolatopsis sp. RTGN1]
MSSPQPDDDGTQLEFTRTVDLDDSRYVLTASTDRTAADTLIIEVLGAGPDAEVSIEGRLTVRSSALEHLGPMFSEVFPVDQPAKVRKPRRRGYGKPTRSYQPWTDELKATLHAAWMVADPAAPPQKIVDGIAEALGTTPDTVKDKFGTPEATREPAKVIAVIAGLMQRTDGAISNQLPRQDLDPERPGHPAQQHEEVET